MTMHEVLRGLHATTGGYQPLHRESSTYLSHTRLSLPPLACELLSHALLLLCLRGSLLHTYPTQDALCHHLPANSFPTLCSWESSSYKVHTCCIVELWHDERHLRHILKNFLHLWDACSIWTMTLLSTGISVGTLIIKKHPIEQYYLQEPEVKPQVRGIQFYLPN